ncbi:MAG: ABC transporter substrate-binding protein, partial [Flavobacteriales bacterium]
MKPSFTPALLLIFLATVTFYSCERIGTNQNERIPNGDVHLGGTLNVAVSEEVKSFLPSMTTTAVSSEIGTHLHCGLLSLNPQTLEVIPGLAESWSVDNKKTSLVFNLRRGAQFHDDECFAGASREITAHDFKYTFEYLCGSENNAAFETTFKNRVTGANDFHEGTASQVLGVQVIDDYTLRIELDKPDDSFLFVLAQPSTAVISETAITKYGAECKVGTGPFWLSSTTEGLVLERNTSFFLADAFGNQFPYLNAIVFKTESTKTEQLTQFFNGELDVVSGLYLDPVREILEDQMKSFSGKEPKYIMRRET